MKLFHLKVMSLVCASMVVSASFDVLANPFKQFAPHVIRVTQIAETVGVTALVTSPLWGSFVGGYHFGKKKVLNGQLEVAKKKSENMSGLGGIIAYSSVVAGGGCAFLGDFAMPVNQITTTSFAVGLAGLSVGAVLGSYSLGYKAGIKSGCKVLALQPQRA